jgi:hypothetical protein
MDGGRRLALAEEVAAAYEQEYGDNWQTCMDRFCSDAAFGASTLMCAEEQAKHAPDTTWAYRWDGSKGNCEIDGSARSVLPVAPHSIAQHVSVGLLRCYLT